MSLARNLCLYKHIGAPLLFGRGAFDELGRLLSEQSCRHVLILHGRSVEKSGVLSRLTQALTDLKIRFLCQSGIPSDPTDAAVEKAAEIAREEQVDCVVGIGGGSVLDSAKVVNLLLTNPMPIHQYFAPCSLKLQPLKPMYLVPTTAGTGSEVTSFSVITDTRKGRRKASISFKELAPTFAVVDPELTLSMPASLTAATGMDAFAHACDALTCNCTNPISDVLAERAIRLIHDNLVNAVQDGGNISARENMAFAAVLGGLAFSNASTQLSHAIAQALGGEFHIAHGRACAVVMPAVLRWVGKVNPVGAGKILSAMGISVSSKADVGDTLAEAVTSLNQKIGMPGLGDLLPEDVSLLSLLPKIRAQRPFNAIPAEISDAELLAVLQEAISKNPSI
ncbi:MAG: iron-containing alcohol dehydrogenase [Acidaminococcus sp.]|jgi:alcohol dehydrogenase class IV|nr:iron-containing alcohol dehydrogenase [Acidaminococcus sp.]MCI2100792.1 iron-containing alcohol dehydrogenase [Acidaminococcus sp.]MCI2115113.1 iron-containing alcohol dehydrogenase [Acidaminococcus sp.]MCI2117189.1 iron-containing alcohol dehydrogenase [Acidaminococcus sp.]